VKEYSDPRMHSAEHILNQTMVRMFKCGRCFRAHIEKKKSKCDYHFDRPLTDKEIDTIQSTVNRVIECDLPVREEFLSREEAQAQYSLERLPEETGNQIRIIRVGDYDACPCIGPHVKSTGEIGGFRILSTSFEDGVLRIRFKCNSLAL
jgi:misacylated tRNA(Ala) deacylase